MAVDRYQSVLLLLLQICGLSREMRRVDLVEILVAQRNEQSTTAKDRIILVEDCQREFCDRWWQHRRHMHPSIGGGIMATTVTSSTSIVAAASGASEETCCSERAQKFNRLRDSDVVSTASIRHTPSLRAEMVEQHVAQGCRLGVSVCYRSHHLLFSYAAVSIR